MTTPHDHSSPVEGCFRCEISADETLMVGDGAVLLALARVYRAGARASRGWPFDADRKRDAVVFDAMAAEAEAQAARLRWAALDGEDNHAD